MASLTSKLIAAAAFLAATPAMAQNYDYLSRSDGISISGYDAGQSNISIQTPTPWPSYVNNTTIRSSGNLGLTAMEKLLKHYKDTGEEKPNPDTVINIGPTPPAQ